jgi:hypothetical protein
MNGRKKLLYEIKCAKSNEQRLHLENGIVLDFSKDPPPNEYLGSSVAVIKAHNGFEYRKIHDDIDTIEDAYMLAQLEMSRKTNWDELIVIFPGWNKNIKDRPDLYEKALELEEKYKEDT